MSDDERKLNIGCGHDYLEGYINLDRSSDVKADTYADLETCADTPLPFPDDHFDEILASHIIEHIHNILPLMQELHRIAKPGAYLILRTPYGSTASAFDDPTHIRYLYPSSYWYFGQPAYSNADYGYKGDWDLEEVGLTVHPLVAKKLEDAGIALEFAVPHLNNIVHEMIASLKCVKPARPPDISDMKPIKPFIKVLTEEEAHPNDT